MKTIYTDTPYLIILFTCLALAQSTLVNSASLLQMFLGLLFFMALAIASVITYVIYGNKVIGLLQVAARRFVLTIYTLLSNTQPKNQFRSPLNDYPMKKFLLFVMFLATLGSDSTAQNKNSTPSNLPNPSVINTTMPAGSYVIAMDNTWQTNDANTASLRKFNLKAYGLIVHLLNNNVKLKRVIRVNKLKDEYDIKVKSTIEKPTVDLTEVQREFKGGPFVIYAHDLPSNIDDLINAYNNNAGGISGITNAAYKVKVYKTKQQMAVNAQHDLEGFKPKACILDDGGNADIHANYMVLAGVPTTNYNVTFSATDLDVNCYTFASEPHNESPEPAVVTAINNFVKAGGNLLAQCAAVNTYENANKLQTSGGITVSNITPNGVVSYPNANLPYSQFEGAFNINKGGSCKNWMLNTGSNWHNDGHIHAQASVSSTKSGVTTIKTGIGASVSKVTAASEEGGLVFYLGNHSYSSITDYDDINGMRMYLNAFLTPCRKQGLMSYSYNLQYNKMKVKARNTANKGYPVTFKLYADKGATLGVAEASDPIIGTVQVTSATQEPEITISPAYVTNTPYVMTIEPNPATYCDAKRETVQPAAMNFTPLPSSITHFTGKRLSTTVMLNWELPTEPELKGFTVQRRLSGEEWKAIGTVAYSHGKASAGFLSYAFEDVTPGKGSIEYRLQLTDLAGTFRFSEVVVIAGEKSHRLDFSMYPNPSVGKITLQFHSTGVRDIIISEAFGRQIRQIKGITNASQVIESLKPGIYLVKVIDHTNGTTSAQKVIVK